MHSIDHPSVYFLILSAVHDRRPDESHLRALNGFLSEARTVDETIHFFSPTKSFAPALGLMARQAFSDAFAHMYDPVPFQQFLEDAYGPEGKMERDFSDPSIRWRVAAINGQPIGYAKLSPLVAPAPAPQPGAMELQQIYVLRPWHGRGVAEELMNRAMDTTRAEGAPEIYLTVFDHNLRAKRFYTPSWFF